VTAPAELVDPRLAAFWASDPSRLVAPDPFTPPLPKLDEHHERLALELAAAFLICARLMRNRLGQGDHGGHSPREFSSGLWGEISPVWRNLAGAALRESLQHSSLATEVSADVLSRVGDEYAGGIGDYLGASSIDSFDASISRQLAGRWSDTVAFARSSAGFGLDTRGYNSFLAAAVGTGTELVSAAAQALADSALVVRAQLIGESESLTSGETAKALVWQQMLREGTLPATARRRWVNSETEGDCAECRHLHKQRVAVDKPFVMTDGTEIWAPQAHPHCACHIELVDDVAKAYYDTEARKPKGPGGGEFTVGVMEPEVEEVQPALFTQEETKLFAKPAPQLFETPLFAPAPQLFDKPKLFTQPQLFEDPAKPATGLFAKPASQLFAKPRKPLRIIRTVVHVVPPAPLPKINKPFYLPVDKYHHQVDNDMLGSVFDTFAGPDFDAARPLPDEKPLTAVALDSKWQALNYGYVSRGRVETHWRDDEQRPKLTQAQVARLWEGFLPGAHIAFSRAIEEAVGQDDFQGGIVHSLHAEDRKKIAEMAGFHGYTDDDDLADKIAHNVQDMGNGNDSLAQAYGDYIVYQRPDKLGSLGEELITEMAEFARQGIDFSDRPLDQVLVFEQGFQPGSKRSAGAVEPAGSYMVMGLTYHSALNELQSSTPPLFMGMQLAQAQPYLPYRHRRRNRHGIPIRENGMPEI
jgi:hypothetical protein